MNTFRDDAVLLLRFMMEDGIISASHDISRLELSKRTGLTNEEFDKAEDFVLAGKLVSGTMGPDGSRWLTPEGIQYITNEMRTRMPISIDAERILSFLIREIGDDQFLTQPEITEGTGITVERYQQACQQLSDFDYVEIFGDDEFPALSPTKTGRQAVHRNFQVSQPIPSIQAGAIFNGPVTGGNIQAIASAIDSEIQQNVSSLSADDLQKEMNQVLEKLISQISEQLTLQQKASYVQVAADFQKEIAKPQPDSSKLHKLLASLGLLSDLGGAIDFSQKTFELIVKAGPYIILLGQMIAQLLRNTAH